MVLNMVGEEEVLRWAVKKLNRKLNQKLGRNKPPLRKKGKFVKPKRGPVRNRKIMGEGPTTAE